MNAPRTIAELPSLGPKSQAMLERAGITTVAQLRALGSVAAYARAKAADPKASLNLLWALESALSGQPWQQVAREHLNLPLAGRVLSAERLMRLALTVGRRALPDCLPNPPVGCVVVRDNTVVSVGHTQTPGANHAEAQALGSLDGDLSDVIVYVTLEPCSFHGRTPSCAQALIDRGARHVVVAILDPDPRNAGRGVELLRNAGIRVELGVLAEEAMSDLEPYLALPAKEHSSDP